MKLSIQSLSALFVVAIAFLLYVRYVLAFGVNVPYWDDFQLLDLARQVYSGQMNWWKLAASKHNEHLIGFAFLVQVLQFLWTGFDYKLQLLTGVLIQGVVFLLLIRAEWKYIPEGRRSYWLAFSSLIFFSFAQYKNMLWAFQTAWFLVSLLLAITLLCLKQASEMELAESGVSNAWFAGAVIAAILASFTLFQGSIVWLAGAVFLWGQCSFRAKDLLRDTLVRKWISSAVIAGVTIAYIFERLGGFEAASGSFHFKTFLIIFLGVHGDLWGDFGIGRLLGLGVIMLLLLGVALVQVYLSREKAAYALPVSLIVFGLVFVLLVSVGRARFGVGPASDSHYTAYSLLTCYGVLSILSRRDDSVPKFFPFRVGQFVITAAILLAWFSSGYNATVNGISWRSDHGLSAAQFLEYRREPDFVLARSLFGDPAMVKKNAEFLDINKFGAFGDSDAVPESVKNYAIMPKSLEAAITRHPAQEKAIRMAWDIYQVGGDLRGAFNPISEQFPHDFLQWCNSNAQPGSTHYLSQYLRPFATDFLAMDKTGY